jgi:hypothetical protein
MHGRRYTDDRTCNWGTQDMQSGHVRNPEGLGKIVRYDSSVLQFGACPQPLQFGIYSRLLDV